MVQLFISGDCKPLYRPGDVKHLLAHKKHWRKGYSAYETACSWFCSGGLPTSILQILRTDPAFDHPMLEKAYFERKTKLDGLGRASQTDVLAILLTKSGRAVLGVEGKVDETFGQVVDKWNDGSKGRSDRLRGLCRRLGLNPNNCGGLRYQLLHRTVATLREAEISGAREAALLVQSFRSPTRKRTGFIAFQAFAEFMGIPLTEPGKLSKAIELDRVNLRLGWTDNAVYEGAQD